ncbi:MAG: Crossover junction endodeoxyribonuclease RuvC [Chlamydiia bacterium]|nr:Crossover junction endodeoxyribonuclease RuvC [Chlamydiia bacterium]
MIILGIDPGTACTGWGVIKIVNNTYEFIDCGTIRPKEKKLSLKYNTIFEELMKIVHKYKPEAVSIETQFVYKNPSSAIKISMARAMAILAATQNDIDVFEYTPTRAKQAVTGSGKAPKEAVEKMMYLLLNIRKKISNDAADALSLALCHAHFMNSLLATIL